MNHADEYCRTLDAISRVDAINAIHRAYVQINAMSEWQNVDSEGPVYRAAVVDGVTYDNEGVLQDLHRVLVDAGHIGFKS